MRWTVIVVLCLAVASAHYAKKKNRFGRLLQNLVDFENDIEHEVEDWSDEESEDSDEDMFDDQYHHYQQRRQQQKHHSPSRKQPKWDPEPEDSSESEEEEFNQKTHKKHQRRERDRDEPKQPCQPKYDLLQKLDQLNAQLAARLHQEAKQKDDDKNTVISPVAVQLALVAVAQGARGNTKRQLNQLLDAGLPKNQNQNAYAALVKSLKGQGSEQGSKSTQIKSTTNLIMGQESAQEQFIEAIKTCFDGEVKKCDFRQKPELCRDQVNQWIVNKMGLKSQTVLLQTPVTGNTKMMSIGTMQVKASWGKQFRKNLKTVQGQFYPLGDQKPTTVKVLQSEGDFKYYEDEQMQVIGVPTQEKQLTIYVILPKDRHGLHHLEKQRLQYGKQVQQLLDRCDARKQTLKVQVPTFQIIDKMDAKQMLRKLGVEDAFDGDEADFSGIRNEIHEEVLKYGRRQSGGLEDIDVEKSAQHYKEQHQHQLHLNKLIQVATVQLDENGLDAASGHGHHQSSKVKQTQAEKEDDKEEHRSRDQTQFHADHAFAFVVKHNPSNQVLLMGRVVDASQKADSGLQEETGERE